VTVAETATTRCTDKMDAINRDARVERFGE
jgi:hypothetical protein